MKSLAIEAASIEECPFDRFPYHRDAILFPSIVASQQRGGEEMNLVRGLMIAEGM